VIYRPVGGELVETTLERVSVATPAPFPAGDGQ
jgi:hypothetical protein